MCHKWQSHDVWFLKYGAWQTDFLSFWTIFCCFTSLTTWKIKIKKKNEKNTWQNYHFTHVYHKFQSYDDGYWDIEHDRQNFLVILDHFLPFYPPNHPKNQNFEKMKRTGDIIILHMHTKNNNHMMYSSWNMVHEIQMDRWTEVIYRGGCPT